MGNAWNTGPEPQSSDTGYIRKTVYTLAEPDCTYEMVVVGTKPDYYYQSTYLRKSSTVAPASCNEPKGWLNTPRVSDHDRYGIIARHPAFKMLVYTISGHTINWYMDAGVFLMDSVTGRHLHAGKSKPGLDSPYWGLAAQTFDFPSCDLVVHWKGKTQYATGTNTGFVRGEYTHFIAPQVQADAVPDVLVYE